MPTMDKSRWSEAETSHLAEHYQAISSDRLRELLPGRTTEAIECKAYYMGIRKAHERRREAGRENVSRRWHPPTIQT